MNRRLVRAALRWRLRIHRLRANWRVVASDPVGWHAHAPMRHANAIAFMNALIAANPRSYGPRSGNRIAVMHRSEVVPAVQQRIAADLDRGDW